jgi:hypothetical protein
MDFIMPHRTDALTQQLTNDTVLQDWFSPLQTALEKIRYSDAKFRALPMPAFCLLGCLRQLQALTSLREQVQTLFHFDEAATRPPLARSTWSDALSSTERQQIVHQLAEILVEQARNRLPDKLSGVKGLGLRDVLAIDATYQTESSHFYPCYPMTGGDDNQKGHMILTHYDVRHGIPLATRTQTQSRGEMRVLKQEQEYGRDWSRVKNAVYVVDRAFIDGRYWDERKKSLNSSVITRLKSTLKYKDKVARTVDAEVENENVLQDWQITLACSEQPWRLIEWLSPDGIHYEYITNDFDLAPGVVAFLYHRRWDEEKYFDSIKNDLANAKAWGKTPVAIGQQAQLSLLTYILTRLFVESRLSTLQLTNGDTTQARKQSIKQEQYCSGIGVAYRAFYVGLSKMTRQVWRFLKNCFAKKSSPELYERQLRPILQAYL